MSTLKAELCHFSQHRLHPGHGKKFAKLDGKVLNFVTRKTAQCHFMNRNPRDTAWTVVYRKKHKKGQIQEVSKKRSRKTVKYQRAIQGSTLEKILQLRNQSSAVRKLQREQALKVAKEKAKAKKSLKGPAKRTEKKQQKTKTKVAKQPKTAKPKVGGKR